MTRRDAATVFVVVDQMPDLPVPIAVFDTRAEAEALIVGLLWVELVEVPRNPAALAVDR